MLTPTPATPGLKNRLKDFVRTHPYLAAFAHLVRALMRGDMKAARNIITWPRRLRMKLRDFVVKRPVLAKCFHLFKAALQGDLTTVCNILVWPRIIGAWPRKISLWLKQCRMKLRDKLRDFVVKRPVLAIYVHLVRGPFNHRTGDASWLHILISVAQGILRQANGDVRNWLLFRKNSAARKALRELYQEAVLYCIEHRVPRWWVALHEAKFDSAPALHGFLRDMILRRAGDFTTYLAMTKRLQSIIPFCDAISLFCIQIAKRYAHVLGEIDAGHLYTIPSADKKKHHLVIGMSVWGERYLHMFMHYCMPSLLTPGNFGRLCQERRVVFLIHTTAEDKEKIAASPITHAAEKLGVTFVYLVLDAALLAKMNEDSNYKYWHLGMVQSIDVFFAKSLHADYHLMLPDTVYSENHFAGLLNIASRGVEVITKTAYRTRLQDICPALDAWRRDGILAIPAADMASIGINHLHSEAVPLFVTNRDILSELPPLHVLIFESETGLHILSPHQTILYIDRAVVQKIPKRYFMTLDSELDKLIPEGSALYCPKEADEVNLLEVTLDPMHEVKFRQVTLQEFSSIYWQNADSMGYWRFFNQDVIDPIRRAATTRPYMKDADVTAAKARIREALLKRFETLYDGEIHCGNELLQAIMTHPKAASMARAINEAELLMQPPPVKESIRA